MSSPAVSLEDRDRSISVEAIVLTVLPLLAVGLLFAGTVSDLVALWATTQDYGHGYLIAPICAFLIWRRLPEVTRESGSSQWWPLLFCLAGGAAWLLATIVGLEVGMQFAVLGIGLVTTWATLGWARFRWVAFPIAYLVFAVPIWDVVIPPLQELTATVATQGVRWLGTVSYTHLRAHET